MIEPRRPRALPALASALALLLATSAAADIVVTGDAGFMMAVNMCLEKVAKAGGSPAEIVACLEASGKDHVIQKSNKSNKTGYNNTNDANSPAAGGTGNGTGTTVSWDPDHKAPYTDGTPRDPCASLLHELTHAKDGDTGMRDPRPGHNGIPTNEIKACTEENKYRKSQPGLDQRKQYGGQDLPPSAISSAQSEVVEVLDADEGGNHEQ